MKKDDYQLRLDAEHGWSTSPEIRAEFESMEQYFHYLKAHERGQIKVMGGK